MSFHQWLTHRMILCLNLLRTVPVYTCCFYPPPARLPFSLSKVPVWATRCMVTLNEAGPLTQHHPSFVREQESQGNWSWYQPGFAQSSGTSSRYIWRDLLQELLKVIPKSAAQAFQEGHAGTQLRAEAALQRQNFSFVRKASILLLKPLGWLSQSHPVYLEWSP